MFEANDVSWRQVNLPVKDGGLGFRIAAHVARPWHSIVLTRYVLPIQTMHQPMGLAVDVVTITKQPLVPLFIGLLVQHTFHPTLTLQV